MINHAQLAIIKPPIPNTSKIKCLRQASWPRCSGLVVVVIVDTCLYLRYVKFLVQLMCVHSELPHGHFFSLPLSLLLSTNYFGIIIKLIKNLAKLGSGPELREKTTKQNSVMSKGRVK